MDIRNRRAIHASAREAVAAAPGRPDLAVLLYAGTACLLALVSAFLSYYLDNQIAETGGLSNMGLRSILSTIQTILPVAQAVVMLGLELGYHRSVLNMARGQESGPRTVLEGFRRFGPILRAQIIQGLFYGMLGMVTMYLSTYLFLMLPMSADFYAIMEPFLSSASVLDQTLVIDEATTIAAMSAMEGLIWIWLAMFALVAIPLYYRFRMVSFCLADGNGCGALMALRTSRILMHRNRFALFRLDLSLWWYYLLQVLVSAICYGNILLALVGIDLPLPDVLELFLFPVLSLMVQLVVHYFVLNRVYTTYALAYESLKQGPDEPRKDPLPFSV